MFNSYTEVRCLQNGIDCNCAVVRTAQLNCAVINSKPLSQ